ncbi:hypothetical protein [Caenispirillum salinarum]|uniref:hypothetical protein n=1 Tax=Caenispirillum salinarum TaxID=859058 RepID=UPI00384D120F
MTPATRAAAILLLGAGMGLAPPGPARAAEPDYAMLDAMAEQAFLCEQASEKEYWSGVPRRMMAALEIRLACLEEIAATLADEFYPPDAFGPGGMKARLGDLQAQTGRLFGAIHTHPLPCATGTDACGPIYEVWARENTVAAVRDAVDAMIDRLKDQSPLHTQ